MQPLAIKTGLPGKLKKWSVFLAVFTIAIAFLVLVGWQFDIPFLKRPLPGSKVMNPVAAVMFILASAAFLFLTTGQNTKRKLNLGYLLALLVLLIGSAKFVSIVFDLDLKIDTLLFQTELQPDRIVPIAAINFILTGIALLLLHTKSKRKRSSVNIILLILAGISLFSILGYLYQVKIFYGLFTYLPMAIHAATCFLFLSLSMLFFNPGKGLMKEITGPHAGSLVARRLIPAAILVPALLGLLRMIGHWTNSFTPEFGVSILVFTIIVVLMVIIWYSVTQLNKRDRQNKLAEAALKESEEQIQTIFNAAPDAVIVMDQHGRITRWNPKAESDFGWTSDEVIGKPLSEIIIPHRYREAHKKGLEHFLKTGEGPVLGKTIEIQAISKNNNEFDVALSISPTLVNGRYLFIGFIRDITERKKSDEKLLKLSQELEQKVIERTEELAKSEKLLSAIINNSTAVVYVKDLEFRYILVNRRFLELFHLSQEDVLGKTDYDFFPKEEADAFRKMDMRTAAADQALTEEERAPQDDGLHTYISVKSTLRDATGKPYAIFGISTDITDLKKAQLEVEQLNEELEQKVIDRTAELQSSNKELESFTYSVSHDLRAPLRIIHGYTDIFVTDYKNKLDEEGTRLLEIIKSNAQRMGQLIDDLLNLSKTGRKELLMHYTDMNNLVRSVIAEQLLLTGNIATIKVKNLEPAECDRSLLRQVWSNFISNAIKYSREREKPVIEINSDKTAHEIVYSIKDNGVGFDMHYADKLFGVFQRLHSQQEFEGTGVGLALVQRIVHKHGGRVWANAEENKGATFYFSLPIIQTN